MATEDYHIATVNPKTRFGFCDAVNGVAVSTDYALQGIYKGIQDDPYELGVATKDTLGGVKIGKGFTVYNDGNLEVSQEKYVLPAATDKTLGGVIAGHNVEIDNVGAISINKNAFNTDLVDADHLANGAVTSDKLADLSVSASKLDTDLAGTITGMVSALTGAAQIINNGLGNPIFKFWICNNAAMLAGCAESVNYYFTDGFSLNGNKITYFTDLEPGTVYNIDKQYDISALSGFDTVLVSATSRTSVTTPTVSHRLFFWINPTDGQIKFAFLGEKWTSNSIQERFNPDIAVTFRA